MPSTDSRIVLITGCSSGGIGYALAKELRRRGYRVFATARDVTKTGDLSDLGCEVLPLDVLRWESIQACVKQILDKTGGKLDILINNAGMIKLEPFLDAPYEDFEVVMETNFMGMVRMAKAVLPSLVANKSGLIVNLGSGLQGTSQPFLSSYAASKAATRAWSEGLALELGVLGIKTMLLEPGLISTSLTGSHSGQKWVPRSDSYYKDIPPAHFHLNKLLPLVFHHPWLSMNLDKFAKRTATSIIKGRKYQSIGGLSTIWWLMSFMPRAMRIWAERRVARLHKNWANRPSSV